jgi:hypothetical protein
MICIRVLPKISGKEVFPKSSADTIVYLNEENIKLFP